MKQFIAAGTIKMAILVVAVCIGMAVTEAQSQVNYVDQSWNWTYETWTGNDTEYKEVAAKLNAQVAKGKDLDKSYWSYVAAAKKNINDPMAQFRRAYFLVSCDWGKKLKLSPPKTSVATEIQAAWYGVANVKSPSVENSLESVSF